MWSLSTLAVACGQQGQPSLAFVAPGTLGYPFLLSCVWSLMLSTLEEAQSSKACVSG